MKYNEDAKLIWESFLNKTDIEFSQYKPYIEKDTDCYAVIIEPREHTDMLLSIRNTMYYLNENNSIPIKSTIYQYLDNKSNFGKDNSFYVDSKELTNDFMKDPIINKFSSHVINEFTYPDEDEKWINSLARSTDT